MAHINENYLKLQAGYLFPEINKRKQEFIDEYLSKITGAS